MLHRFKLTGLVKISPLPRMAPNVSNEPERIEDNSYLKILFYMCSIYKQFLVNTATDGKPVVLKQMQRIVVRFMGLYHLHSNCLFETLLELAWRLWMLAFISGLWELLKYLPKTSEYYWDFNAIFMVKYPVEAMALVLGADIVFCTISQKRQGLSADGLHVGSSIYKRFFVFPGVMMCLACLEFIVMALGALELVVGTMTRICHHVNALLNSVITTLLRVVKLLRWILSLIGYVLRPVGWAAAWMFGRRRRRDRTQPRVHQQNTLALHAPSNWTDAQVMEMMMMQLVADQNRIMRQDGRQLPYRRKLPIEIQEVID